MAFQRPDLRSPAVVQGMAVGVVLVLGLLFLPSTQSPIALAGLVVLAAGALALEVELPQGGTVSMGHAVIIAYAGLMSATDFVVVLSLTFLAIALPVVKKHGLVRGGLEILVLAVVGGFGRLGQFGGKELLHVVPSNARAMAVVPVLGAGALYLGALSFIKAAVPALGERRAKGWRTALSVYVSLMCTAALLALAYKKNLQLAAVSLVPLLVLRYSLLRYFDARRTYLQTTQALSMIPEVAGLTPVGHAERTSVYASALAEWLSYSREQIELVATVARLHHIGQIAHPDLPVRPYGPEPDELRMIGQATAEILGETAFLKDLAGVVAAVHAADPGDLTDVEAIVRVASTLDDLVGQNTVGLSEAVLSLLARHEHGIERTMALKLAELCDSLPAVAERAQLASAGVTKAAAKLDLVGTAR